MRNYRHVNGSYIDRARDCGSRIYGHFSKFLSKKEIGTTWFSRDPIMTEADLDLIFVGTTTYLFSLSTPNPVVNLTVSTRPLFLGLLGSGYCFVRFASEHMWVFGELLDLNKKLIFLLVYLFLEEDDRPYIPFQIRQWILTGHLTSFFRNTLFIFIFTYLI